MRSPNLLAILHPAHRRNYPMLRRFIESHGLEGNGQKIYTVHKGTEYQATVAPRGLVELYKGVRYSSPDTALKKITGRTTRKGMDLWLTQVDGQRISLNQLRARAENAGVKLR